MNTKSIDQIKQQDDTDDGEKHLDSITNCRHSRIGNVIAFLNDF
jgi:hypothetical protein